MCANQYIVGYPSERRRGVNPVPCNGLCCAYGPVNISSGIDGGLSLECNPSMTAPPFPDGVCSMSVCPTLVGYSTGGSDRICTPGQHPTVTP